MKGYIATLAAALLASAPALAGELDNEFGSKKPPATAKAMPTASSDFSVDAKPNGALATELDAESPMQRHRRGWHGGWGGGWGRGWGGGWGRGWGGGWGGWRGGWNVGWRGGWGGWNSGWWGWPRYSYYSWPSYAYYAPTFSYGYFGYPSYAYYGSPAWGYCW